MLELRPNCECCDKDLPPHSEEAMICSYECTFCADCVEQVLQNVCPNCGGDFRPRPIRPIREHRPGVSLAQHPASKERVHMSVDMDTFSDFAARLADIEPRDR
ncbi:MAG: DUF1272 domain-containing protein [Gammaproteobacteria bacterium]